MFATPWVDPQPEWSALREDAYGHGSLQVCVCARAPIYLSTMVLFADTFDSCPNINNYKRSIEIKPHTHAPKTHSASHLTHSLTHPPTHSLTHSLTHLLRWSTPPTRTGCGCATKTPGTPTQNESLAMMSGSPERERICGVEETSLKMFYVVFKV